MHMSVRTWWVNHYEEHGKVKKSGDCIDVTFRRNVEKQEAPGFSITSVSCPGCGGSFDAVRQKNVLIVAVNIIWKRKAGSSSRCI